MSKRKRKSDSFVEDTSEERFFLNVESVSEHLYCSICQEVFSDPQRAPCGHSFCKKCILPWLKQSNTCPEDRKSVRKQDLHHDFILENIIGDQMVACPYRKQGCLHVGQLQMLASHRKNCAFNPAQLPDFLKQDTPTEANTSTHLEDDPTALPEPGIPSLKMRLFQAGEGKRKLLSSMFENKDRIKSEKRTGRKNSSNL